MRNEDHKILTALEELITIAKEANVPAEIYHLKASRKPNWHLLDSVIQRVETARKEGLKSRPICIPISQFYRLDRGYTYLGASRRPQRMDEPMKTKSRERLFEEIREELRNQPPRVSYGRIQKPRNGCNLQRENNR